MARSGPRLSGDDEEVDPPQGSWAGRGEQHVSDLRVKRYGVEREACMV